MKPRVVFLFDSLTAGGAQRHVAGLMQALSSDFEIWAISCQSEVSGELFTGELAERAKGLGITGFRNPAQWVRLARALAELRPDLVVGVNQVAGVLAIGAQKLGIVRAPCALAFHSTLIGSFGGWIRTVPFFPAAWSADALIYVSKNQAAIWKRRGLHARRTVTIVNGIDLERFPLRNAGSYQAERERLGFTQEDYVIGLCAGFRPEKNHAQLIRAIAALRAKGVPARALLVGDGPTRAEIGTLASEAGIAEHVVFAGLQADVRPFLTTIDVGVLTSTRIETLSLAALEIMATGAPMVLSDIGGASEVVEDGVSGFLFDAGDDKALVDRLTRLADPSLRARFAQKAREQVEAHFDHHAMNDAHARLFQELIALARSRR